ncbi:MAG TPA: YceI family protein [Candidatus Acidoferrales bacterium]|nr:YceI family protein [Candidatus Acidoferrales bacterium]
MTPLRHLSEKLWRTAFRFVHWYAYHTRRAARFVLLAAAVWFLLPSPALRAQASSATLDPAATNIDFTLGATLHTVHGSFKLKSGKIQFDASTGKASGALIIDATSGDTGNSGRDHKMHKEILESAKFPEIAFTPAQVSGAIAPQGTSQIEVSGVMRLHGQDHEITLPISVERAPDGALHITSKIAVPYIKWGLKNPSTFVLHVSDTVNVEVHATVRLMPAASSH